MLKKRLIARLDIKSGRLVKTIRLEGLRVVGDPAEYAKRYGEFMDELYFIDIVASLYGRNSLADLVSKTVEDVFIPVTVAGGIRSVEDVRVMLNAGADKVAISTAVVKRPELITEVAEKFGSQCMVLQIDAKREGDSWRVWTDGGREPSGLDVLDWAQRGAALGAGEISLTSIDQEGTGRGCDIPLISAVSSAVAVPVIGCGGIGSISNVTDAFRAGADAVAMSGALHFSKINPSELRETLNMNNIPVREVA